LAARIIANAIHIHRDPATFSVTTRIPPGRSHTNDDEILQTYVGAHLKLREYMLSMNKEWQGSGHLVLPWTNSTTTVTSNVEHHKWTVRRLENTSNQRPTLDARSISGKDLLSSKSHTPPSTLSGSSSSPQGHRITNRHSKADQTLSSASSSANDREERRLQHAAHLDASRTETPASSAVVTGTQGRSKTPGPCRRALSFVKRKAQKGKKP